MTTNPLLQSSDFLAQLTSRTVEAFSLMADANQKVLRELVDLSASTAKEGVRVYAELQSSAGEAVKERRSYVLPRQDGRQEGPRNPFNFYQKVGRGEGGSARRTLQLSAG